MMMRRRFLSLAVFSLASSGLVFRARAQSQTPSVKRIPTGTYKPTDAEREELTRGVAELGERLTKLKAKMLLSSLPLAERESLLPDVEIYHKAVDWAVRYNEFFSAKEIDTARKLLAQGTERVSALERGEAPWTMQTGLVVRGYRSRVDGSVQPYGMVVPTDWKPGETKGRRLDFFYHGRGENLTELAFIDQRQKGGGEFQPAGAFVLHPYGRFCNANRFAGETDTLEALEHAKKYYAPIDENRVVIRGFSMGGAACWQMATHQADLWAAAAPGAGFTDTFTYTGVSKKAENERPPWYEQKLWRLYDPVSYALNLAMVPTVAYSGEIDPQKAAADNMAASMQKEGLTLTHVIGPQTAHKYHPESKPKINAFIDAVLVEGRDPVPRKLSFVTYSLRYNKMRWLTVDALEKHWERATVEGVLGMDEQRIVLKTANVGALTVEFPAEPRRFTVGVRPGITVDGKEVAGGAKLPVVVAGKPWKVSLKKTGKGWEVSEGKVGAGTKHSGLQGPIDDAFVDSFVMVTPTGTPMTPELGAWTEKYQKQAGSDWRQFYRGDAPVVRDKEVTPEQIANANLILWGDPQSNAVLAKVLGKLPVKWDKSGVTFAGKKYDANHVPLLIFPNPLNPTRYVVLNTGYTFWGFSSASNAQHSPKLPDWAVLNTAEQSDVRYAGKVVVAGFFDEQWRVIA